MRLGKYNTGEEVFKYEDAEITIRCMTFREAQDFTMAFGSSRTEGIESAFKIAVVGVKNLTDPDGKPIEANLDQKGKVVKTIGEVLFTILDDGGAKEAGLGMSLFNRIVIKNSLGETAKGKKDAVKNSKG